MKMVVLDSASLGEGLSLEVFEQFAHLEVHGFTAQDETASRIGDADIILTNKVCIDQQIMAAAKNLKLICTAGTGTNHIDTGYAQDHGIRVCNIAGYSTQSVAQHTFAMLFYLYENMAFYDRYCRSGAYVADEAFSHYINRFHELDGRKWGIIGMGRIGKRVAELARAFGCEVSYCPTSGSNHTPRFNAVALEQLLKESDILSIHAPLTERTKGMLDYSAMRLMKRGAYLLNLGRGGIIVEADLARILAEGHLAGVGLDVLEREPMSAESPLRASLEDPRLLITPHIGWAALESRQRMVREVCLNIEAFLQGKERNVVV